jgi:galactokinase
LGRAGQALLLDCRHLTSQTTALPTDLQVVICDTRAERELTGSEYGERRAQCEAGAHRLAEFYPGVTALRDVSLAQFVAHEANLPEVVARRCRFIIQENQRVLDLARALSDNNRDAIGLLTAESYTGARDLYEIGAPAMESMMRAMRRAPGVVGARQAGAGFGGCMVAFVENETVDEFIAHVEATYQAATGLAPKVYPVRAAAGAGPLT